MDAAQRVFAIRPCKSNEAKATAFSKAKGEQTTTLSCGNKNIHDTVAQLIKDYDNKKRYKVTGFYNAEQRVMYFDMSEAVESAFRATQK